MRCFAVPTLVDHSFDVGPTTLRSPFVWTVEFRRYVTFYVYLRSSLLFTFHTYVSHTFSPRRSDYTPASFDPTPRYPHVTFTLLPLYVGVVVGGVTTAHTFTPFLVPHTLLLPAFARFTFTSHSLLSSPPRYHVYTTYTHCCLRLPQVYTALRVYHRTTLTHALPPLTTTFLAYTPASRARTYCLISHTTTPLHTGLPSLGSTPHRLHRLLTHVGWLTVHTAVAFPHTAHAARLLDLRLPAVRILLFLRLVLTHTPAVLRALSLLPFRLRRYLTRSFTCGSPACPCRWSTDFSCAHLFTLPYALHTQLVTLSFYCFAHLFLVT